MQDTLQINTDKSLFPWQHSRRYNAYPNYSKRVHGDRVQKVALDVGFTCPNRDGTKGFGGCTYCNNDSFNPSYCNPLLPLHTQIDEGIKFLQHRYKTKKYVGYLQAYSNTYKPLAELKKIYEEILLHPQITGLVIGTRADCVDDEKLDYIESLSKNYDITIEYGIESCYNKTLALLNRCETYEEAEASIRKTAERGIKVCGHLIFGLPGETRAEMLEEAKIISALPLDFIKLHQLHIVKGTVMASQYKHNPELFTLFSLEEYLDFIVSFLELLNPKIVVERLFGEAPPKIMAGPTWGGLRNDQVLQLIEDNLEKRNTWQGRIYGA
ncbi:MAG: TIGR01212 family radical SAM protein [Bacteroidetes bacterium]|nr:TIGR01212 family radical SAM protein [Bacteroidota bacterium]